MFPHRVEEKERSAGALPHHELPAWVPGFAVPDQGEVKVQLDGVQDGGMVADADRCNAEALQKLIRRCADGGGGAVFLPAGNYLFCKRVHVAPGVVLRGAGRTATKLRFRLPAQKQQQKQLLGSLNMAGKWVMERGADVTADIAAGDRSVRVSEKDASAIAALLRDRPQHGRRLRSPHLVARLAFDNEAFMYTRPLWDQRWAQRVRSQMVEVEGVDERSGVVRLRQPLRLAAPRSLHPRLRLLEPCYRAGVEHLSWEQLDPKREDFCLKMERSLECWARDCGGLRCLRAHVSVSQSLRAVVAHCSFRAAHDYGPGGHGYGVTLNNGASDALVYGNSFHTLRHAMMVQMGANGNVFYGNESAENSMCDVSIHGHFSHTNLFERNTFGRAISADHWGPTGPHTVLFKNHVRHPGGIHVKDDSRLQFVWGNRLAHPKASVRVDPVCRAQTSVRPLGDASLPETLCTLPAPFAKLPMPRGD